MKKYQFAGPGIKKMFIATVGTLICSIAMMIPIINMVASIGIIVFAIVTMIGLYQAGKEINGCRIAFFLQLVYIVINTFSQVILAALGFATEDSIFALITWIVSLLIDLLSVLTTVLIIYSIGKELSYVGDEDLAQRGTITWIIYLAVNILSIIVSNLLPFAFLQLVFVAVLPIVSLVFYVTYLNVASKAFMRY